MNRRQTYSFMIVGITAGLLVFLIWPDEALARAGGGRSRGGGGGAGGLLLSIAYLIYYIYTYFKGAKPNPKLEESATLHNKIADADPVWNAREIRIRVRDTFHAVQEAWRDRNQEPAKYYMSETLYQHHKRLTDAMIERGEKNEMHAIHLKDMRIVEVTDYNDNSKDAFCVLIHGEMIDYLLNEETGAILDGDRKVRSFLEFWRFQRQGDQWVLDEIDDSVDQSSLERFHSFSETVKIEAVTQST